MDIKIFKGIQFSSSGLLDTDIFAKPMNQFLYLPFTSFHPRHNKKAFIIGELSRYIRICSSFELYLKNRNQFILRLRARGFPLYFIQQACSKISYKDRTKLLNPINNRSNHTPLLFNIIFDANSSKINWRT
jgi:hypothetical protein